MNENVFTQEELNALLRKHGVGYFSGRGEHIKDEAGYLVVDLDGLPTLTFFVELAKLADVPIESIRTDSEDNGPGCDTCGYGGGTLLRVAVPIRAALRRFPVGSFPEDK